MRRTNRFEFVRYIRDKLYSHVQGPHLWPLLTGGYCSEVGFGLCYEDLNWDSNMIVAVGR